MKKTVILESWTSRWIHYRFNIEKGKAKLLISPYRKNVCGRLFRCFGITYTLIKLKENELYISIDNKFFSLSDIKSISIVKKIKHRQVQFLINDESIKLDYSSASDKIWNKSDITYDGLDEELDDFFVMLFQVWKDKSLQTSLLKKWSLAVAPRQK